MIEKKIIYNLRLKLILKRKDNHRALNRIDDGNAILVANDVNI